MLPGLVALLAEGVDRNIQGAAIDCTGGRVALLAEGVDRNLFQMSINIGGDLVALLAEGVDRNYRYRAVDVLPTLSPSSRRAWIEISYGPGRPGLADVALLAEGVDRNLCLLRCCPRSSSRPPRGGRG